MLSSAKNFVLHGQAGMDDPQIAALVARAQELQQQIRAIDEQLTEQERVNVSKAMRAAEVSASYELLVREAKQEASEALAKLRQAEETGRLILQSGAEHEADLQSQIDDATARASAAEQTNVALASAYEDEVFSLISRIAVLEKHKSRLMASLASSTSSVETQ